MFSNKPIVPTKVIETVTVDQNEEQGNGISNKDGNNNAGTNNLNKTSLLHLIHLLQSRKHTIRKEVINQSPQLQTIGRI